MIPSSVPRELQGLKQIEEMLIARALPLMRVYIKPGGQRGLILATVSICLKILKNLLIHCLTTLKTFPLLLST